MRDGTSYQLVKLADEVLEATICLQYLHGQ